LALEVGVKVGCGSDVGVFRHGENFKELEWMVRGGMRPAQALVSATSVNAKILRQEAELGQLAAGMKADIIAVRGDPTSDISCIRVVAFVMKDDTVYKQ
jgi:imidazolonepropionase-like amidohydrolase